MAKVELQKIRVAGLKSHYEILVKELQRRGIVQIKDNPEFSEVSPVPMNPTRVDDFELANVEFTINFLSPYATKKGKLESMLTGGKLIMSEKEARKRFEEVEPEVAKIVEECSELEEKAVRARNEIDAAKRKIQKIKDFAGFNFGIGENLNTDSIKTVVGKIPAAKQKDFLEKVAKKTNLVDMEIFHSNKRDIYFRLTYLKSISPEIEDILSEGGFNEVDLSAEFAEFSGQKPADILKKLEKDLVEHENFLEEAKLRKKELARNLDNLKLVYDFYVWRRDEDEIKKDVYSSEHLFAFEAWMPKEKYPALDHWIKQVFVGDVVVMPIEKEKGEKEPALLKNKGAAKSFELITEMYGSPSEEDIDPTPGLTPFFIMFFGICLSDVGY